MDGHLPCLGWSHTNPTKVTHQKEVHYRLGIWHQVKTAIDGQLHSLEWAPTNPRMVTHKKEVFY